MFKAFFKSKVNYLISQLLIGENLSSRLYNNYNLWANYCNNFKSIGLNSYVVAPFYIVNPNFITIGSNFSALQNLRLEAHSLYGGNHYSPNLIIGDNVCFNSDIHIGCINKVYIGNNVLLASRIFISDHSHGEVTKFALELPPIERPLVSKGPVIIEDNVWLGEGVCVLPNITIGKNTIVGANAVITKSFPANSVVAGNPAKIIKMLD